MKREIGKTRKQHQSKKVKTAKPSCGTLSYIAECRGTVQKTGAYRGTTPPESVKPIVRN